MVIMARVPPELKTATFTQLEKDGTDFSTWLRRQLRCYVAGVAANDTPPLGEQFLMPRERRRRRRENQCP